MVRIDVEVEKKKFHLKTHVPKTGTRYTRLGIADQEL